MWELIPLALLSALYPTLIAVVVVALALPRPAKAMAFFLLGGMIASVSVGLVIVFALQETSLTRPNSVLNPIVYFGAGAFAFALAAAIRRRPPTPHREGQGRVARLVRRIQGPRVAFLVGIVLDLAPSAWYVVALKDIAESSYTTTEIVVAIVLFCLVQYALIEIPLLGFVLAPERAADASRRFSAWLADNSRTVAFWILVAAGCFMMAHGVATVV